MESPYTHLPESSFWKKGVAEKSNSDFSDLYSPKFHLKPDQPIASAGSCFAQYLRPHLEKSKAKYLDIEPPPKHLDVKSQSKHGFGQYSARYGNIYTARQLLLLAKEAYGLHCPTDIAWRLPNGRFIDALRPSVDPEGFERSQDLLQARLQHIGALRNLFAQAEVFIFTLGLTEAWTNLEGSTVYPTAPGTIAGDYDPQQYTFHNFSYSEVKNDLLEFVELVAEHSSNQMKVLLTVSPVSLTATASHSHILLANTYSKSVLRAVAGDLSNTNPNFDYFPSYDIFATIKTKGEYYNENRRTVRADAVGLVMSYFLESHPLISMASPSIRGHQTVIAAPQVTNDTPSDNVGERDIVCEEMLLEAFGQ